MDFDRELIVLIAGWGITFLGWGLLFFVAMSLLDRENPGDILFYRHRKIKLFELSFFLAIGFCLIILFAFGFSAFFWMVPDFPESEGGHSNAGAALLFGLYATYLLYKIAERLNGLVWSSNGDKEIISDVEKLMPKLLYERQDVGAQIDELLSQIESDHKRKYWRSAELSAQKRIEFLRRLKLMI